VFSGSMLCTKLGGYSAGDIDKSSPEQVFYASGRNQDVSRFEATILVEWDEEGYFPVCGQMLDMSESESRIQASR
jgi:hypothetical protein